ncbi:hypothetical protein YT1_1767 [Rhodococcus ruber]|nr:hypothetical protein YT1_1767 [Rhodococcus ruber]
MPSSAGSPQSCVLEPPLSGLSEPIEYPFLHCTNHPYQCTDSVPERP